MLDFLTAFGILQDVIDVSVGQAEIVLASPSPSPPPPVPSPLFWCMRAEG
jgi:hypothetical protein